MHKYFLTTIMCSYFALSHENNTDSQKDEEEIVLIQEPTNRRRQTWQVSPTQILSRDASPNSVYPSADYTAQLEAIIERILLLQNSIYTDQDDFYEALSLTLHYFWIIERFPSLERLGPPNFSQNLRVEFRRALTWLHRRLPNNTTQTRVRIAAIIAQLRNLDRIPNLTVEIAREMVSLVLEYERHTAHILGDTWLAESANQLVYRLARRGIDFFGHPAVYYDYIRIGQLNISSAGQRRQRDDSADDDSASSLLTATSFGSSRSSR